MQNGSSVVRVDLSRLRRNVTLAREGLPEDVKLWAVVKANAGRMSAAYVFGGTSAVGSRTWNALVAATR